jgi:serine/threonine protein kinase
MERTVRAIDPSLNYVAKLEPSSTDVYKVELDGGVYVLKTNSLDCYGWRWGIRHLTQEADVLQVASEVEGITHLVRKYERVGRRKISLLKEFYEGKTLRDFKAPIKDTKLQRKLEGIVRDLHSIGVAQLDLDNHSNIVVSPDASDVRIVDLGCGVFSRDIDHVQFQGFIDVDMKELELLFGQ